MKVLKSLKQEKAEHGEAVAEVERLTRLQEELNLQLNRAQTNHQNQIRQAEAVHKRRPYTI